MAENKGNREDINLVKKSLENPDFYTELVKKYENYIMNYILKISGVPREEAEDIAQEIFLKAYLNLNDFDQKRKFSTWLFSIAHNETISYWRKHRKRLESPDIEDSEIEFLLKEESDIAEKIDNQNLKKEIRNSLSQLDFKYREVLQLRYLDEYSYEEISDIIKKPVNTVGTLISRAKKLLKKEINLEKYE